MKTIALLFAVFALTACGHAAAVQSSPPAEPGAPVAGHGVPGVGSSAARSANGMVQHVVIVMMENRSFDELFGTYPGVNGIPQNVWCNPDPKSGQCVYPYEDTSTINYGGPHSNTAEATDLDGGKLDGFIKTAESPSGKFYDPYPDEVMGYHTCKEVPTYCNIASAGVLADNAFAATTSWSTMAHLYMVSNWSASCTSSDPMSCVSNNDVNWKTLPDYAWTDLTWVLHQNHVSWGYFVYINGRPLAIPYSGDDEADGADQAASPSLKATQLGSWNPLPDFEDVATDGETANIQPGPHFDLQAKAGKLPQVSWVIPGFNESDHPPADLVLGQRFVQNVVNLVENGPDASSTLIIVMWDEWGGFFDHVVPPVVDGQGYGFRVPMILYGPMVKAGTIDHQLLSTDAVNKFIEDNFCSGERLDPATDGRPDSRPDVRERTPGLGDLRLDLN